MKKLFFLVLVSLVIFSSCCDSSCTAVAIDKVIETPSEYLGKSVEVCGTFKATCGQAPVSVLVGECCNAKIKLVIAQGVSMEGIVDGASCIATGIITETLIDSSVIASKVAAGEQVCAKLTEKVAKEGKVTLYEMAVTALKVADCTKSCDKEKACGEKTECTKSCGDSESKEESKEETTEGQVTTDSTVVQ